MPATSPQLRPAVFLDRDGTIIADRGYLERASQVEMIPGAIAALHQLQQQFRLFIVTNQCGIGKNLVRREDVDKVNAHLLALLGAAQIGITDVYVCPHTAADRCCCRKPSAYFLQQAAVQYHLDLPNSYMIGDHPSDLQCGRQAGATPIYVLTGHGAKHLDSIETAAPLLSDITAAAEWIAADQQRRRPAAPSAPQLPPQLLSLPQAAQVLGAGGIVALPTETVYGLGANALNADAVAKVFAAKGRPANDPLIVHIATLEQLAAVAAEVPPIAASLIRQFWPGPLTLVLPKHANIPATVTAGLDTVAVRMPSHPVALELIRRAGCPIAAPSANRFGAISPTTAAHVAAQLGERIDGIVDGGSCSIGVESTIVSVLGETPMILRPGGISSEALSAALAATPGTAKAASGQTPGSFASHYAPAAPVVLCTDIDQVPVRPEQKVAYLRFCEPVPAGYPGITLSADASLTEAAQRLYAALHQLDRLQPELIIAETVPDSDIGTAINDRLQRAAGNRETLHL